MLLEFLIKFLASELKNFLILSKNLENIDAIIVLKYSYLLCITRISKYYKIVTYVHKFI